MADKTEGQGVQLVVGKSDIGMSGYQLTASLTGSLAWPIAAVIIAVIFHRQIAALLGRLTDLSWGEAKVSFNVGEKLDKIEDKARELSDEAPEPMTAADMLAQGTDNRFGELLKISPNAAILDAWAGIETSLVERAKGFGIGYLPVHVPIEKRLAESDLLSASALGIVRDMRQIRNAAAHNREMTTTDALRFQSLVTLLNEAIKRWKDELASNQP